VIAVVDYGAGNVTSVRRALEHLGYECAVTGDPAQVERAERVVVPGVGNFRATQGLASSGLATTLRRAIAQGKPVLGICLGLQWLFDSSAEAPELPGLGIIHGRCEPFPAGVKSPHVGWDQLDISPASRLLRGLSSGVFVYFTHGYYAPLVEETVASCSYGTPHSAALERGDLFAVQFHPEKSGDGGLLILDNFCSC